MAVAQVLGYGCGSEICLSIVEAVTVYVVAEQVTGDVNDLAMHPNPFSCVIIGAASPSDGV